MQDDDQKAVGGYDHAMILAPELTDGEQTVASLFSPEGDVRMDIATTLPAMQVYTGNYLISVPGKSRHYTPFSGVAFETQFPPDAVNHPEWGSNTAVFHSQIKYITRKRAITLFSESNAASCGVFRITILKVGSSYL